MYMYILILGIRNYVLHVILGYTCTHVGKLQSLPSGWTDGRLYLL